MLKLFGVKEKKVKEDDVKEPKSLTLFNYLTDIMSGKKGNIHLEKDPNLSSFDTFMILRFLSYDEGYLPFINVINGFQDNLTKEEAYKMLVLTIPKTNKFLKFPKKNDKDIDNEDINLLSKYFQCSNYEVEDFIKLNLIDKDNIEKIMMLYGGR